MEEVRSYWQVASIAHFCNLFGKPFKLPNFEPEELEQAFIIDVPEPPKSNNINNHLQQQPIISKSSNQNNIIDDNNLDQQQDNLGSTDSNSINSNDADLEQQNHKHTNDTKSDQIVDETNSSNNNNNEGNKELQSERDDDEDDEDGDDEGKGSTSPKRADNDDDPSFQPPPSVQNDILQQQQLVQQQQQQQADEQQQQDLHLLVKLGIALLKPHFNSKITLSNWENYLRRVIDSNWVDLEHHPSPLSAPIITSDGVESIRNLTFNELTLSDKIDVFCALCDYRFWCEDASEAIKDYPIEDLRLESIGKDSQGFEYWYFFGTRLFREDKELSQQLTARKERIKELEITLIDLEKVQKLKEQEIKRKAELEKAKQLANEAKEARLAAAKRKQQEEEKTNNKRRKDNTPSRPLRSGLRERRSSAASNSNDSQQQIRTPTTRSKLARQQQATEEQPTQQSSQKTTRGSAAKGSKQAEQRNTRLSKPESPKRCPIEECKEELEKIAIKPDERAAAWSIHCESLEEWESFATKFDKTKSVNEKYLQSYVNQEILPIIRAIYAKRAAEARRKEKELFFSLASRRVSTRIISKRAQEEEEERRAQQREAEIQKKKAEAELRLRAELEREMRAKKNRFVINGGTSSNCSDDGGSAAAAAAAGHIEENNSARYNLRQQHCNVYDGSNEFDGIIHPDKLSEFYEALELIIDTVKTSKHAWPFVDPVPDTVPGYYDLIQEPMDIKKLRTKVEFREYRSLIEVEKDFQLLVNNCEKFNGPKNVYTKMVYRLWNSFRKNVRLYLQRDLHMDEFETFIYPPPAPVVVQPQTTHHDSNVPNGVDHRSANDPIETTTTLKVEQDQNESNQGQTNGIHIDLKPEVNSNSMNGDVRENCVLKTEHEHTKQMGPITGIQTLKQALQPSSVTSSPLVNGEVPRESLIIEQVDPPEIVCEEVVIDSYAVPCQDETYFIWPQDVVQPTVQEQNQ